MVQCGFLLFCLSVWPCRNSGGREAGTISAICKLCGYNGCVQERTWGIAYKIAEREVGDVMAHLDNREKCGYHTTEQTFHPKDNYLEPFKVAVYFAPADNPWYLGPASFDQMATEIATRSGPRGHNSEYLFRLAETIRMIMPEPKDDHLFELEVRVKELIELNNQENHQHSIVPYS